MLNLEVEKKFLGRAGGRAPNFLEGILDRE